PRGGVWDSRGAGVYAVQGVSGGSLSWGSLAAGDSPDVGLQQCRVSREEIQTQQLCGRLWKTAAAQGVLWQGNDESRSLFHCYVNEVDRLGKAKSGIQTIALDSDIRLQEAIRCIRWPKEEPNRVMKCDIPNFINTDQNYSFGEDDLLILEPPIVLENNPVAQTSHKDLNWKRALERNGDRQKDEEKEESPLRRELVKNPSETLVIIVSIIIIITIIMELIPLGDSRKIKSWSGLSSTGLTKTRQWMNASGRLDTDCLENADENPGKWAQQHRTLLI
ncbi:Melanocortin-2 receptor accessory protein 2, partial [Camelus dromedarius]